MSTTVLPEPHPIATTSVHPVTLDQTADLVLAFADEPRPSLVVTPNVDHLSLLEVDAEFRSAYASARLRVCDGVPLMWLLRACARPVPGRVNGTDLFFTVCERAAARGRSVFIAGGLPAVLCAALTELRRRHPDLTVDGFSPPPGFEGTAGEVELLRRIDQADPDVVMVCVGAPRSEIWAARQLQHRPRSVMLCVGSAVDFAAGARRRAPRWMQRSGLEWLHRLAQEPRRLAHRYLVQDRAFVGIAARELCRHRFGHREPGRSRSLGGGVRR